MNTNTQISNNQPKRAVSPISFKRRLPISPSGISHEGTFEMINAYGIIFSHVVLPDSLLERKKVLRAFETVMRKTHPAYESVKEQIAALEKLENLKAELPLRFIQGASGDRRNGGAM